MIPLGEVMDGVMVRDMGIDDPEYDPIPAEHRPPIRAARH
jgi:hypothetical protein